MNPTAPVAPNRRWSGRSVGGAWLLVAGLWLLRRLGLPGSLLCSLPVAALLLLVVGPARAATIDYWRRLQPHAGGDRHWALALRHWSEFGRVLCDRLLAYTDPRLAIDVSGPDADRLRAAVATGGCLLVSAHIGNWELAGRLMSRLPTKQVHLVQVGDENPRIREVVNAAMGDAGDRQPAIIDPRGGLGATFAIRDALARGEVVCMLGDRALPGAPLARVPFLGSPADLPAGPLRLAATCKAPLLACFLLKTGRHSYRMRVIGPLHLRGRPGPRTVAAWGRILECVVRAAPDQWHNFYRFWP